MLLEGVRYIQNKFLFDFKDDKKNDIVFLKYANTKSTGKRSGIQVYFAWRFNENANSEHISLFRKALKSNEGVNESDKQLMINKGVIGFDSVYDINTFDIVVSPKSSSPLVSQMTTYIKSRSTNLLFANESIIKNSIDKISINYDAYLKTAKTPEEREKRKKDLDNASKSATKSGTFQIKKVHAFMKKHFSNFLKFQDDTSKQVFNTISGGKVLIVDDYLTTGTTMTEMIRNVMQYNPKEVVCFFLIK